MGNKVVRRSTSVKNCESFASRKNFRHRGIDKVSKKKWKKAEKKSNECFDSHFTILLIFDLSKANTHLQTIGKIRKQALDNVTINAVTFFIQMLHGLDQIRQFFQIVLSQLNLIPHRSTGDVSSPINPAPRTGGVNCGGGARFDRRRRFCATFEKWDERRRRRSNYKRSCSKRFGDS
uniref:Uncharacterized protein n=1 Tax=Romanomermis culicivorax TaxID=13658 RepID=A0A915L4D2_ROMCU